MGLENRQYYQDDDSAWRAGYGGGGGSGGPRNWSAVTILIVINVALFVADAFSPSVAPGTHWLSENLALRTDQLWRVWTFLTYGFVHASIDSQVSIFHVGGNMLVLFFLGRPIEYRLGKVEFLKFYLVAIVFAGIVFVLVRLATGLPSATVGASGAVTAVVMLFVFYYPKEILYLFGVVPIPAWVLGVALVVMDLSRSFNPESQIAWEAHLGGALFAFLYYKLGLRFDWLPLEKWKLPNRSRLKIHRPGEVDPKLQRQADELLDKIAKQGEESLTGRERKILNRYSKEIRKQRQSN